jgi:hypothetical protein
VKYSDKHKTVMVRESDDEELYNWRQAMLEKLSKDSKALSDEDTKMRGRLLAIGFPFQHLSKSEIPKTPTKNR